MTFHATVESRSPSGLRVVADRKLDPAAGPIDGRSAVVRVNLRRGVIETQAPAGPFVVFNANSDVTLIADTAVGGHRAVAILADNRTAHFEPSNPLHQFALFGVSINAAAPGDPVSVRSAGRLTFAGWSFTPGAPVFALADGLLGHAADPYMAAWIGTALDETTLLIRPEIPLYLA